MELALQVLIGVVAYTTFLLIVVAIRRRHRPRTGLPRPGVLKMPGRLLRRARETAKRHARRRQPRA